MGQVRVFLPILAAVFGASNPARAQSSPCESAPERMYICDDVGYLHRYDAYDTSWPTHTPIGYLPPIVWDIALHPHTGQMFGCTSTQLYRIDKNTGSSVLVGSFGPQLTSASALEFSGSGALYAREYGTGDLFRIDSATAAVQWAASAGSCYDTDLAIVADAFAFSVNAAGLLEKIDLATGVSTSIGPLAMGNVEGLEVDCLGRLWAVDTNHWYRLDPTTGAILSDVHIWTIYGNGLGLAIERASGVSFGYCESNSTAGGCVPALAGVGTASAASSNGFELRAVSLPGQRSATVFYGASGQLSAPWGSTNTLCVAAPRQRTGIQSSGGSAGACDGLIALDWNAFMAANGGALGSPRYVGQSFDAQAWMRDPASAKSSALSSALHFELTP